MSPPFAKQANVPARVVLLGSYAPSLINFRGSLIEAIVARGHHVFALAPDIDEDVAARVRELGADPVSVTLGRTSLNLVEALRTVRELRLQVRRLKPDVVIAYTIKPIVLGAAAARAEGVKRFVAMITGMGYPFQGGLHPKRVAIRLMAMAMYRRALARSHFVIFQNPDDRRDFQRLRLLPRRVPNGIVNGSGVDLSCFEQRPLPPGLAFLMIGRFLKDKGIREYGEAAQRLKRDFPHVRVALVGWADESPDSISRRALDRIIAGGVDYLGHLADVRPALEACSVYILPSYREGTPRSVLEAMAVGRPIITTDAPGCRETVVDGVNGFLVPPRNADELYRAMRRFVEQPELCASMGEASRRLVEEKYDVNDVNTRILEYVGL